MRIEADAIIPFSRETVFRAYRDEILGFVDYLPNVHQIEVLEREEDGANVRLVNRWHAGGEIPAPISKMIGSSALSWRDVAQWDQAEWTCGWQIETSVFAEAVSCRGTNRFVDLGGDRTRLDIQGQIDIDLKAVKGIPKFLAGAVGPKVEQFLVRQITTNLTSVSDALTRYLQTRMAS